MTDVGWWWTVAKKVLLFFERKGLCRIGNLIFFDSDLRRERGRRSFFTRRELFLKDFLRYLPQPEEITHFFCFPRGGPSLVRTMPSLARTVLKPPVLQPRGTTRSAPTCSDGR